MPDYDADIWIEFDRHLWVDEDDLIWVPITYDGILYTFVAYDKKTFFQSKSFDNYFKSTISNYYNKTVSNSYYFVSKSEKELFESENGTAK